jgi:hypothetical protein
MRWQLSIATVLHCALAQVAEHLDFYKSTSAKAHEAAQHYASTALTKSYCNECGLGYSNKSALKFHMKNYVAKRLRMKRTWWILVSELL